MPLPPRSALQSVEVLGYFPRRLGVELLKPVRHLLPSTVLGMAGAQKCLLNYPKGPPRCACEALQSRVTEAHLTAWGTWDVWESAPVCDLQRLVGEINTPQLIETRQNVISSVTAKVSSEA